MWRDRLTGFRVIITLDLYAKKITFDPQNPAQHLMRQTGTVRLGSPAVS